MKKTIIIKTGDTFPAIAVAEGDFEDWICTGLGIDPKEIRVVDVPNGQKLPRVESCKAVVIAGSHAMVTEDLDWSLAVEGWLSGVIESGVPVLGICYGHQLLARAMGGEVDYHPKGLEIGTTTIEQIQIEQNQTEQVQIEADRIETDQIEGGWAGDSDPLFRDLPKTFAAHVCHSQTVVQLPPGAVRLAKNDFEPNHAFRIGRSAWGVQFHPEYDIAVMGAYARNMETLIKASGLDLSTILEQIRPTPTAMEILRRFGKLAGQAAG
jgi:GMP synthase (glutamine-hydrolysing)